ncbi:hypothetical protein GCM10027436_44180 [Actinophytocola sediminis]
MFTYPTAMGAGLASFGTVISLFRRASAVVCLWQPADRVRRGRVTPIGIREISQRMIIVWYAARMSSVDDSTYCGPGPVSAPTGKV